MGTYGAENSAIAGADLKPAWSEHSPTFPAVSLIVAVDNVSPGVRRSLDDMHQVLEGTSAEIIVASRQPLVDSREGERVIVFDVRARGDRYDRAALQARGHLLAFTDVRTRLPKDWITRVVEAFARPEVAIAGGPVLPRSWTRGERISALMMDRHLGATPSAHLWRVEKSHPVAELAGSNLVIRADLFWAVGGFQSPDVGGEAVRLCHKVRSLLGRDTLYTPDLAVSATARRFPRSFLDQVAAFGRVRGGMARRHRELAPLVPYGLPALAVLALVAELAMVALRRWEVAIIGGALLLLTFVLQATRILVGSGRLSDRLLAALAFPLVPLSYGLSYLRGFFGPNLNEISPPRHRERPLRILIINWRDIIHPRSGGAEMYMHEIGRRWVEQGMDVSWLCQRFPGSQRFDIIDGIRVHRVGGRFTLYPLAILTYVTRLHGQYDLIVDCENGIPFFAPLFAKTPAILVVHHVHTEIFRRETRPPLRWLGLWLEGTVMPFVYRRNRVVAVSESTRDDLVALGFRSEHISVVHNGVDMMPQTPPQPAPRPRILYMGRLTPQKCVDVIIRALPEVLRAFPDARLDIIGQGPDRARLERLVWSLRLAQEVRFHGYLPRSARDDLAAQAWVAVCPSSHEGWGIACVEASALGLPVVASNVNGLRDSVRDGETGVLVPHGDPGALARTIVELLSDPDRRGSMGAAGWRWAASHTWDRSASELLAVLSGHSVAPRFDTAQTFGLTSNAAEDLQTVDAFAGN